ncbi:methionyl-tRNA formyltransferase [Thermorudis peleae]|uniref:methionyl-tRNA formyltransferase n=1 Tax=Thermorudis peleae TaxID=1382356 RepID=UPI000A7EF11D|nr:methionyl-tRNA formyltransferase [Thermorudis peleae]
MVDDADELSMGEHQQQPIRTMFFGTPDFAVPILRALAQDPRFSVVLVVTQPDRPSGRGRTMTPPPVKQLADALGLPVFQPRTLRHADVQATLAAAQPDLAVVAAYGLLLPRPVLDLPPHGCVNVHPSLLPRYRGATPIQAALLNGDSETGITLLLMTERLDAGPILAQWVLPIQPDDTAGTLHDRLAAFAADHVPDALVAWVTGKLIPREQDERLASYTRPLTKEDGCINWTRPAVEIDRMVRAFSPWPRAWTQVEQSRLIILRVALAADHPSLAPGELWPAAAGLLVGTGSTPIVLLEVIPEGRAAMSGLAWWRGARLPPGTRFAACEKGQTDGSRFPRNA